MTLNVTSCRRKRQIDENVKSAEMRKDPEKEAGKERGRGRKGKGREGPEGRKSERREQGRGRGESDVYSVFLYDVYMSFAYCFILLFIPVGCKVCKRQIHLSSLISLSSSV